MWEVIGVYVGGYDRAEGDDEKIISVG